MSTFPSSFFILIEIELKLNSYSDYYVDSEEFSSHLIFLCQCGGVQGPENQYQPLPSHRLNGPRRFYPTSACASIHHPFTARKNERVWFKADI